MRGAWGAEVTMPQVQRAIALAEGYADIDRMAEADDAATVLGRALAVQTSRTNDPQIGLVTTRKLQGGAAGRCADDAGR